MTNPVLGIVGAGQLARMTAQAAISLAVETCVLATNQQAPACSAASRVELGDPADPTVLERFSGSCDVLTFDHEQVDPHAIAWLEERGHVVRPGSKVLRFANKAYQRVRFESMGFPVPRFRVAMHAAEIEAFANETGWPVVVKPATGGYDGRGVFVLDGPAEAHHIAAQLRGIPMVVESMLDIGHELAVIVARRPSGDAVAYPVVETFQVEGICVESIAPAATDPPLAAEATSLALRIAEHIGSVGVLAVEFFVTPDGIVVNELAPRPHNSGHWTIEGSVTSQFENHIRGVLDWPLGDTDLTANAVATVNVLGGQATLYPLARLRSALEVRGASVHLYAKSNRPGRKLGHVTALGRDRDVALTRARAAAAALGTDPVPMKTGGS